MTIKEYKTLEEAIQDSLLYDAGYKWGQIVSGRFKEVFVDFLDISSQTFSTDIESTEANTLWCQYIAPKFHACYIGSIDPTSDTSEATQFDALKLEFMKNYVAILHKTYDTYKILIDTLTAQKTHLMDGVGATRTSKFNDTPQASNSGFDADNYVTNITTETTENDLVTTMARINEIEQKLSDYYSMWANEFGGIFIYD